MAQTTRRQAREDVDFRLTMYWETASGQVHSIQPRARDASKTGMRLATMVAVEPGTHVYLDAPRFGTMEALVRYCVTEGPGYRIGLEFTAAPQQAAEFRAQDLDYYEVLQLSRKAEPETIHRVFRIMAARYHPDNPLSGDREKFLRLTEAYEVLGDPQRREKYDAREGTAPLRPLPLFQAKAFVDDKEGEVNRRLGVLCLLYAQRRREPEQPVMRLLDLEEMMSIPREYLEFTLWYLKQKKYVEITDGADLSLTATGVDFVEDNAPANSMLVRLLQRPGGAPQEEMMA